ncbi:MAG: dihydroorotate dehydrogenase electron transfer subunit [Candidatus Omnitrophota bacterium]
MKKVHNRYKILSIEKVCDRFICVHLDAPLLAKTGKPGQFVNVRIQDTLDPFFRRPFGIYRVVDKTIKMLIEIRGKGTSLLAGKKPGDFIDVLGPLGKTFTPPAQKVKNVVLIAGGIGIAPLIAIAETLRNSGKNIFLLYGAKDKSYMFDFSQIRKDGCSVHIATDDGSAGSKGQVSTLFDLIPLNREETFIYTCGPNAMMKSVQQFAKQHGLSGECSCEEIMACGTGACLGCVVNTVEGYKTACHDGPVFDLEKVIF